MFIYVSSKIIDNTEMLTHADQAIGDGDHGVGMARGFNEVILNIEAETFNSIGDLLGKIGMTLLSSIGGAAGAIFGTFFRGGAKNLKEQTIFDSKSCSLMLDEGLEAIIKRGNAKLGDKTMVDALDPAAKKANAMVSILDDVSIDQLLEEATEQARLGMEKTKDMIATLGKAKTLGERSLGHADPGAISTYLILKSMMEYTKFNI
ncbi:MAG: dihydroxyacetone kinase subunit L [archaeon]|nr:dihydroxyacetone kinase subunit L [archaeon]